MSYKIFAEMHNSAITWYFEKPQYAFSRGEMSIISESFVDTLELTKNLVKLTDNIHLIHDPLCRVARIDRRATHLKVCDKDEQVVNSYICEVKETNRENRAISQNSIKPFEEIVKEKKDFFYSFVNQAIAIFSNSTMHKS